MRDLLIDLPAQQSSEPIGKGAILLRGFARAQGGALLRAVDTIAVAAPFRHLTTPGGHLDPACAPSGPDVSSAPRNGPSGLTTQWFESNLVH